MTSTELHVLVSEVTQLASLPDIYYRLEEAINHPHMSLDHVGRIIGSDPNLAGRLLRIANSAFFGYPGRFDDIGRAVTAVGTQQLKDLVLATTVVRLFKDMPVGRVSMRSFWEHSVACGIVARSIATYRREANVERLYVAGLLHDVGRLLLFMRRPEIMRDLLSGAETEDRLLYQLEYEALGFDHAAVGGALLQVWHVPESLSEPVSWHHVPEGAQHYPVEASIVHVADIIVHGLRIGGTGEQFVPPLSTEAWNRIGIPDGALPEIIERSEQQHQDAVSLFVDEVGR